jgi:transcription elongation factor GreB
MGRNGPEFFLLLPAEQIMNKAFVKESGDGNDEESLPPSLRLPSGSKNYMTPHGYEALRVELDELLRVERPRIVETVAWAASNGDRSENADYIYGKRRLREIDRRVRFLIGRIDNAEVVDPCVRGQCDQIFFGATVTICDADDSDAAEQVWQIVGIDEADVSTGKISWVSPLARALLKAREGDMVRFMSPSGVREVEIVAVRYA